MHTKFWLENIEGRYHSDDIDVHGRITLEVILENYVEKSWIGFI
jgi:hypothetical protein